MSRTYRKGDIVTIRAVVERHYDAEVNHIGGQVSIKVEDHHQTIFVKPEQLTIQIPFFAPGERVQKINSGRTPIRGTVVANSEDSVWVKFDTGKHGTVPANELEALEGRGLDVAAA
jgi:hypothetical protein